MDIVTTLLILLNYLHLTYQSECVIDNRSRDLEWERKLHDDLTCDYHWDQAPNKENVTEVKIRFLMKDFDLDSFNDLFSMYSWTTLTWIDPRLTWNVSDYGGIERTYFWSYEFWTPILELNNRLEDEFGNYYGQCKVENTGHVVCVPRIMDVVQCVAKMSDWPYDTQKCTLEYTLNKLQKNVSLISRGSRAVSMVGAEYGPEWTIVDYEQENNVNGTVPLKITFVLERNGDCLGAIIVLPSILLSIITVSSLLIDVNDSNRMFMVIFAMLCHFFYVSEIGFEIPKHSVDPPTILLFYRFSIVLNVCLLVLTVGIMKLRNRESIPAPWISAITGLVLESHGKYFIWPRWETDRDMFTSESVNSKDVEVWNGLANIINSVCMFVTIILYSILVPLFIPTPPPFN